MANQPETDPTNTPNPGGGYIISFPVQAVEKDSIRVTYTPNPDNNRESLIVSITTNVGDAWGSGWFTFGQLWIRLYSIETDFLPTGPVKTSKLSASFCLNTPDKVPDDVVLYNWSYTWLLNLSESDDPESLLPPGWTYEAKPE